jgi:acyl-homoserine-lactone acylase
MSSALFRSASAFSRSFAVLVPVLLVLQGCAPSADEYRATIRRTSYGIPHIEANDLASLGFGEGYAQAEDHLCTIADQVIRARGERAKFFGPGEENANLLSDVGIKGLEVSQRAAAAFATQGEEFRSWYQGFVDGYNLYLEETGRENVPGWCSGAEWVSPITVEDLAAYHRLVTLTTSGLAEMIAAAKPPEPAAEPASSAGRRMAGERFARADWEAALDRGASNGWALGRDWTEGGRGMLIANPHYPWVGSNRFSEKHLVIPGALDVYGVSLIGGPGVALGFNDAVGWTHTVSAGHRITLFKLDLVDGDPTSYVYDGETRQMTPRPVAVEVRQDDGSLATEHHTVWFSHHGVVLDFPGVGWTEDVVFAVRDANEENDEAFRMWLEMDRAGSMVEFQQVHANLQGMPWVNTIAASADGIAWYADTAATPYLSDEAIAQWERLREEDPLTQKAWAMGTVLLPGGDPIFEWRDDPDARDRGVVAYEDMPGIERGDYVFNANDSFWLANSSALIEGDYSPLHGLQKTQRSPRTRNNDLTLSQRSPDRPAGEDRRFSLDEMGDALLSNRSLMAELVKPELVERCETSPVVRLDGARVDLTEACRVLADWNDRLDIDSRGAVLFREWLGQYQYTDVAAAGGRLFAVEFDSDDPIGTPRGLAQGPLAVENLARAVKILQSQNHPLDIELGELQYPPSKTSRRIPIHGGNSSEGVKNLQVNSVNYTTLEPLDVPARVEGSGFLTEKGYPVVHGSSFVLALEYTDDGPKAKAFLTYSQSGDPESEHFDDQTLLFSKKQWRPVLFTEDEIAADTKREYTVSGPRP